MGDGGSIPEFVEDAVSSLPLRMLFFCVTSSDRPLTIGCFLALLPPADDGVTRGELGWCACELRRAGPEWLCGSECGALLVDPLVTEFDDVVEALRSFSVSFLAAPLAAVDEGEARIGEELRETDCES